MLKNDDSIMVDASSEKARREYLLDEFQVGISDALHKRLIHAYQDDNPVQSMEVELIKILLEVLNGED